MTIDLHIWCELEFADLLRSMSEGFGQRCQRLDWVLILMFDDEEVLDCFKPLVKEGTTPRMGRRRCEGIPGSPAARGKVHYFGGDLWAKQCLGNTGRLRVTRNQANRPTKGGSTL